MKRMSWTWPASVVAVLAASVSAQAPDGGGRWDARLSGVSGDVAVFAPGDPSKPARGEEGLLLEEGDRVVLAKGASAGVALDGGSLIELSDGADFTLTKLARAESEFGLAVGTLLAKIHKLGEQRLQVRTSGVVAAVRGTEFGVSTGEGRDRVGVFDEGHVSVDCAGGGRYDLTPRLELSARGGKLSSKPGALKFFLSRREGMRAVLARLDKVGHEWKGLPPGQRRDRREKSLARLREGFEWRGGRADERRETRGERRSERRGK